ncbi:MAG TPA: hypothetical protein PLE71_17535 [Flavobacteriales bacterium]|nr:hypothetical protein [Flavobacteriales bacterium]
MKKIRNAIIDIGTNTFNLLVFEGDMHILHAEELPVFLGRGGIEKGIIADDAMERGKNVLRMLVSKAGSLRANHISVFGTSALRNAKNGAELVNFAQQELGIMISVISGNEEAELILAGVRQAVAFTRKPMLIMDIGGGSIEFILATDKALMWKRSFELGVTRLRDRIPVSDPITLSEEERIAQHLDDQLDPLYAIIERHEPHVLIGSAGSFDSLASIISTERHEPLLNDAKTMNFTALEFDALRDKLMRMTRAERLNVPGLPEHRVDTLPYALIAIDRVLTAGAIRELAWSKYALKEGGASRMISTN